MVPISHAKSFLLRTRANKKNANEKTGRLTKTKTSWIETPSTSSLPYAFYRGGTEIDRVLDCQQP
jgi:hypothetical protein